MSGYQNFLAELSQPNREQATAVLDQYVTEIIEGLSHRFSDLGENAAQILSVLGRDVKAGLIEKHFRITLAPQVEGITSEGKGFLMLLETLILQGRL